MAKRFFRKFFIVTGIIAGGIGLWVFAIVFSLIAPHLWFVGVGLLLLAVYLVLTNKK